jgi:hypothetical protein
MQTEIMDNLRRRIETWGAKRATDNPDAWWDWRSGPMAVAVEGFVDVSAILGGGVYILANAGEVVFVGRASGTMLTKIASERSVDRPKWLGKVTFDQVLIRRMANDKIAGEVVRLIAEFQPKHNQTVPCNSRPSVDRRI